MKKNEVLELSVGLAVEIVKYCELFPNHPTQYYPPSKAPPTS